MGSSAKTRKADRVPCPSKEVCLASSFSSCDSLPVFRLLLERIAALHLNSLHPSLALTRVHDGSSVVFSRKLG